MLRRPNTGARPQRMNDITYYTATRRNALHGPSLRERIDTDTCVIGAGYAGLNTALGLAERGRPDCVVLESHGVGRGASGRNGGFVFGGFSRGEAQLLAELGKDAANLLYHGTRDAVGLIKRRVQQYSIDCELRSEGVILADWFRDPERLRRKQALLREHFGVDWQWLDREALQQRVRSARYSEGLLEADAASIHPLNYVDGLANAARQRGVRIFERSPAIALRRDARGWSVTTPEGEVRARRVVLSCGGYLAGLRREVDRAVLPIATYVMVTEPLGASLDALLGSGASIYDTRFAFDYYRPLLDRRLLWGGRIAIYDRSAESVKQALRRDLLRVFPSLAEAAIDYAWSGWMSYARHEMPQIGEVEPGLWVAQAFGGHGVAPTTFAGELIASAIAEGDSRWKLFQRYGLSATHKPFGLWAAQLTYWWLQGRDRWDDWREAQG